MEPISPATLLASLEWRYATKIFDPSRRISDSDLNALERSLVLSPSSFGLQPYRFVLVESPEVRALLRSHSWNQAQVTDASHYLVLAIQKDFGEAGIAHYLDRVAEVRGVSPESLDGYRKVMIGNLVQGPRAAIIDRWASNQLYIAYGVVMTAAALLGIDACPLEGLEPEKYDEILGLPEKGLTTCAALALGYRAEGDKYATLPKVRFPDAELVSRV